ncbi:MAG TPA: DUF3999 family protein [Thermoanaerobaculia bacterium]|nr:DUF3999 family protein [Thermoanaerobaculia bacterium]
MSSRLVAAAALAGALATPLSAWEFHRTITPAAAGANLIRPDAEILAHTKPWFPPTPENKEWKGLEDLRLFDGAHQEIPYLLLVPQVDHKWHEGRILSTPATKTASGFELDLGAAIRTDTLRVDGLARSFLKRYRLEGSGDRARWTVLIAEGTLFDLPEQSLTDREVHFASGEYRYLRVTWDDRSSARVAAPGRVSVREAEPAASAPTLVTATLERIDSEPRRSRYIVHFPGGRLPAAALTLQSSAPDVLRSATVYETRLDGSQMNPVTLGQAVLRKASRGDLSASNLRVPIERPEGSDLELEIDDGDNPPLSIEDVFVELVPLPVLYFESASAQALDAEYGDPTAERPRYDLEANRAYLASGAGVLARWGNVQRSALGSEAPKVHFAGAVLDPDEFRFNKSIQAAPAGLVTLPLDADVLARTRFGFPDLRVVDLASHQVPYLLEKRAAPFSVALSPPSKLPQGERKNISRYRIHLPYPTLRGVTVVIDTDSAIFDRTVTVEKQNEERREVSPFLASVRWTHTESHVKPPALQIPLDDPATSDLVLSIDEGDNAPIHLIRARVLLPSWRVRFYHPGGALRLLYGSADTAAPRYDLALLAPQIIGKPAREISFQSPVASSVESHGEKRTIIFWAAIILAVLVLLLLLAKLLKESGVAPDSAGS